MILGVNAAKSIETGSQELLFNKSKTKDSNFSNVFEKKINDLSAKNSGSFKKAKVNNFDGNVKRDLSQSIDSKDSATDKNSTVVSNNQQDNKEFKTVDKDSKIDDKLKKLVEEALEDGEVTEDELKQIKETVDEIIAMLANGEVNQQLDQDSLISILSSLELIAEKMEAPIDSQVTNQDLITMDDKTSMNQTESKPEEGLKNVIESIKELVSNTDDIEETVNSTEFKDLISKLANELSESTPKEKPQVAAAVQSEDNKSEIKLESTEESKATEEVKAEVVKNQKTVTGKEHVQSDAKEHTGKEETAKGESLNSDVKTVEDKYQATGDKNIEVMKFENTLIRSARVDNPQRSQSFENNIMRQVVNFAKNNFKVSESGSEMVLKLKPNNLGEVSLKVAIDKGVIQAEMNVENQTVKQVLESNLTDLRNALSDKGFTLGALDVSVGKDSSGNNQDNSKSFKNKNKFFDILDIEEEQSNTITSEYSTAIDTLK